MPKFTPNEKLRELISKKRPTDEELLQAGIPGWKTVSRKEKRKGKLANSLLQNHPEFTEALKHVRHQYEASLPGSVPPTYKHNKVLQRIKAQQSNNKKVKRNKF